VELGDNWFVANGLLLGLIDESEEAILMLRRDSFSVTVE